MKQTEKILKALANRRRLSIIKYLDKAGSANVSAIAGQIGLSFKSTSKHLTVLRGADIVQTESAGLNVLYSLVTPLNSMLKAILSSL